MVKLNKHIHIRKKGSGAGKIRRNPRHWTLAQFKAVLENMPQPERTKMKRALNAWMTYAATRNLTEKQSRAVLMQCMRKQGIDVRKPVPQMRPMKFVGKGVKYGSLPKAKHMGFSHKSLYMESWRR